MTNHTPPSAPSRPLWLSATSAATAAASIALPELIESKKIRVASRVVIGIGGLSVALVSALQPVTDPTTDAKPSVINPLTGTQNAKATAIPLSQPRSKPSLVKARRTLIKTGTAASFLVTTPVVGKKAVELATGVLAKRGAKRPKVVIAALVAMALLGSDIAARYLPER